MRFLRSQRRGKLSKQFARVWKVGGSVENVRSRLVRWAWQLSCKHFIINRGDVITVLLVTWNFFI